MIRIRIFYAKTEPLRYTGNLDVHKIWERILRRAQLPLAYSQGFHPQPRLNQACPLPLGLTSRYEILDAWLEEDIPLDIVERKLIASLPPGIVINRITLAEPSETALQCQVNAAEYQAEIFENPTEIDLHAAVATFLTSKQVLRERRNKPYDLRPLVHHLEVMPPGEDGTDRLKMCLAAGSNATGRPDEVLAALGLDPYTARIERLALFLDQ